MAITQTQGSIVTFYSWKGGVGRTMALANVAVQLARQGHGVLIVDWDLEAPGLGLYFTNKESQVVPTIPSNPTGLMGLLREAKGGKPTSSDWETRLANIPLSPAEASFSNPIPPTPGRLHLLPSGIGSEGYSESLAEFSWDHFFAKHRGGEWLERLREQWAKRYDFVLIDARTGLSDSSGVCTVQMPDILVLVFTANDQSLDDGIKVVEAAQNGRNQYAYDRSPLAVVPLLSRWCGDDEVDLGVRWMERIGEAVAPFVSSWLPKDFTPHQLLEKIRIPHVARFSFGEPLPVLTHSITDPTLPGQAYVALARLLGSRLSEAGRIIAPAYQPPPFKAGYIDDNDLNLLSLVQDSTALHKEIARLGRVGDSDGQELADFLNKAGLALSRLARHAEAEPLFRRSLLLAEEKYGAKHPEVAIRLNNLAQLLMTTNRLAEAEPLMRRALLIDEQGFGPDHPNVAIRLNNLALLLQDTNRLAEAESSMRQALVINERHYGPNHSEVAITINNLAQLLQHTNRLTEAEPLMRRALNFDEQNLGPEHPDVAIDLSNLAQVLNRANRLAEAEPLMRRALLIDEQCYGPYHPDVATDLNNLALLLTKTKRLEEAEPLIRRALVIAEKSFGPGYPQVAVCLNNLAQLFKQTHRSEDAEPLMRRALAILADFERQNGHTHPQYSLVATNYRALLLEMGKTEAEIDALLGQATDVLPLVSN